MAQGTEFDSDGFPIFPPLTGGHEVPIQFRTLPRAVASLRTGVLVADSNRIRARAMVVFLEWHAVDGMALCEGRSVTGPDALDEIADAPVDHLAFFKLPSRMAAVLGNYFLPTEIGNLPAAHVLPDSFIGSLARPDTRGCVLIQAGDEMGLVFLAAGEVVLATRPATGGIGGMEVVADLFARPGARIWVRLGPLSEEFAVPDPAGERAEARPPSTGHGSIGSQPAPSLWSVPRPADSEVAPGPVPEPSAPPPPAASELDEVLEEILQRARERLGRHAAAVEEVFRGAPRTREGLRSAAESVRGLRIRLVSRGTLEEIADQAVAILGAAGAK
ncbi:MAG: hypothetical protein J2P45_01115 [Candidatus Dormibacteraeota bacterium]|nr:hypothetical protein [Candidatus Dormibacteraeota bacterium]